MLFSVVTLPAQALMALRCYFVGLALLAALHAIV
jgi:hypothetical protein